MKKSFSIFLLLAATAGGLPGSWPGSGTRRAADAQGVQDIRFTGSVAFNDIDSDGDALAERLSVDVEVEVLTAGEYSLVGVLEKHGQVISYRPTFETMLLSRGTLQEDPGTYTVSLGFSGEEIYRSGANGPYNLVLNAIGERSNVSLTVQTPAYDRARFGELGATITGVSSAAVDGEADGGYDIVEATLDVEVRRAGYYLLQGSLSKQGISIVHAAEAFSLPRGPHTLNLRFPGLPILRSGLDGPYAGTVSMIDSLGHTFGGIEFATQAYSSAAFTALLELDGRFNDLAVDTNNNGLFDILRIEFGLGTREAGTFLIDGVLKNPNEPLVVFADTVMTLATDPKIATLDFVGSHIREQQLSGPYEVEIVLRDPDTHDELDRVRAGSMTAAYEFTDFDPYGWAEIMLTGGSTDRGVDTDGNGLFDELRVEVEVELARADFYEWRARLVGVNGTEVDSDSRQAHIDAGIATIHFIFDGRKIGERGVDGPYSLKGFLMFGRSGVSVVLSDLAETRGYAATEFESGEGWH
jgi:hypothetical protein